MPQYWLMKTEPETFSFDDLERVRVEPWTGVRSMFARFHMRNMNVGDEVLFYHSSCEPPGVAGLARIVRTKVIDETQFDPASKYFDEKATREKPIWDCVDVEVVARLPRFVALHEIRALPELAGMPLLQRGMRLSVQPVTEPQYRRIVALADEPPIPPPDKPAKPAKKPAKKLAKKVATKAKAAARRPMKKPAPKRPAAKGKAKRR